MLGLKFTSYQAKQSWKATLGVFLMTVGSTAIAALFIEYTHMWRELNGLGEEAESVLADLAFGFGLFFLIIGAFAFSSAMVHKEYDKQKGE